MDKVEQLFKETRAKLDHLEPDPEDWMALEKRLHSPASKGSFIPKWFSAAALVFVFLGLGTWIGLDLSSGESEAKNDYQTLQVGQKFPEMALRDPHGELIPLESLQGKVVLVEFWASYSTVCTEEHCYYFLPVYDEFRERGFEIYGVSVDSSATSWVTGIEQDQLPWPNVTDLQGPNAGVAAEFALDQLPATFLLDQEGTIVARDVDASELRQTLSKLLASKE